MAALEILTLISPILAGCIGWAIGNNLWGGAGPSLSAEG